MARSDRSLLDVFLALAERRFLIGGITGSITLLAMLISFLLPVYYTGTTRLMPPQQDQSNAAALLGQIGALTGATPQALNLKNPSELFVSMLQSSTVFDEVITRFKLR